MVLRSGMREIEKASKQRQDSSNQDYIREIILQDDGDQVKFRLVTDQDSETAEKSGVPFEIIEGEFHNVPKLSKSGKQYWEDTLCKLVYDEEEEEWTGECEHCDAEVPRASKFLMWAYVYGIYHRERTDKDWTPSNFGNIMMYKESIDAYCIWKDGYFMRRDLEIKAQRFGTLCDRDYVVVRQGVRKSTGTRRTLQELQKSPMPEEIREGAIDLPSLEDYATRKVRSFGTKAQETPDEINLDDLPDELGATVSGFGKMNEDNPKKTGRKTASKKDVKAGKVSENASDLGEFDPNLSFDEQFPPMALSSDGDWELPDSDLEFVEDIDERASVIDMDDLPF